MKTDYIHDNVQFYVIIYAPDPVFDQVKPLIYGTDSSPYSYIIGYDGTHSDAGGKGDHDKKLHAASRTFMIDQMKSKGLAFDVDDYEDTGYAGYDINSTEGGVRIIPR